MKVLIIHLKVGDLLAQDVVMPSGRVLMTVGMTLTESMIELIKKRDFKEIEIQETLPPKLLPKNNLFTDDVIVNDTMKLFKKYIDSRDDYYDFI